MTLPALLVWLLLAPIEPSQPDPLWDLARFPPHSTAREATDFCWQAKRNFEAAAECAWEHKAHLFRAAANQADAAHSAWCYLASAANEDYPIDYRRMAMGWLRETLGDEDYFAGRMPFPAYWAFQELR